jgi:hypothetical protein
MVDRVTVKGSARPTCLYTYDVPSTVDANFSPAKEEALSAQAFFARVPPDRSEEFRAMFYSALANYLGGEDGSRADWQQAEAELSECLAMAPSDGPALALLGYIRTKLRHAKAPPGWRGYRPLDEK